MDARQAWVGGIGAGTQCRAWVSRYSMPGLGRWDSGWGSMSGLGMWHSRGIPCRAWISGMIKKYHRRHRYHNQCVF